jgi:CheY-like chemotaxis protein
MNTKIFYLTSFYGHTNAINERLWSYKEIRKLKSGATIPIIAITAGTGVEINEKCIAAGMNDYISKPIIKRVIEDALVKWTTT